VEIAKRLWVEYYFADPYKFDSITEQQLKEVEEKLNNRPRKRLAFLSPKTVFLSKTKNGAFATLI